MPVKMLCILDGLGLAPAAPSNAVYLAKMPTFRKILSTYPWITLNADGEFVGQEDGLVGNSEVGHTNIGGLKLVKQLSLQVTESAETNFTKLSDDQLFAPDKFLQTRFSAGYPKIVHLFGLFSTASVHSDLRHWLGAVRAALLAGAECVVLHLISDGRDSDRQSLLSTWREFTSRLNLDEHIAQKIVLGSLGGRFYLMDRDRNFGRNWQGLQVCLDQQILVDTQPILEPYLHQDLQAQVKIDTPKPLADRVFLTEVESVLQNLVANSYAQENFDETIVPVKISGDFGVKPGDTLWLINFRADRMRQLVTMLADLNERLETNWAILGMNDYGSGKEAYIDADLTGLDWSDKAFYYPIFKSQPVSNTLAQRISELGKTQLHIAETEKYNHITFFLNGCQHINFPGEDHYLIPSNKVQSHAEKPQMKNQEITDHLLANYSKYDYILCNYASPDMVGHTGDVQAAIAALESLDQQLARLLALVETGELEMLLIADHGNIEVVGEVEVNGQKYVDTAHNPNPVPCVFVSQQFNWPNFLNNLQALKQQYNLDLDLDLVVSEFQRRPQATLENPQSWLTSEQIPVSKLPLWYSGAFLLAM